MAAFRRNVLKFCYTSQPSLRYFSSSNVTPATKQYRNLSDEDKTLVEELIANAPGSNVGMTSFMTGKGITDPTMKLKHKQLQAAMIKELARQFPSTLARLQFFGKYLKNMTLSLKRMNDTERKLKYAIRGVAIKYRLIGTSFQGIIVTKTLTDMYGDERATEILRNAQKVCGPIFAEPIIKYLEDKVPHHLRYAVVNGVNKEIMNISENDEGVFDIEWIDDDIYSNTFEFHVKRCVFRDIGREFGDTDNNGENNLTYKWFCQFDDKMIPNLGQYAEFEFKRNGTLGKGCSHCDFKFQHCDSI